jgi:N-acetylglutamate synthase-like GNAT family acetyltransferase
MSEYNIRRATVDDLPQLMELWRAAHLPADELEKQFTDFQIAENEQGEIVAAIALHIEIPAGRVHAETFGDFALADELRPKFWERLKTVAQNHGLYRLWTDEAAPWWKKDAGFAAPSAETLGKLPASFGIARPGLLTLQLRDEAGTPEQLDKELEVFKDKERHKRERMVKGGKILTVAGTLIAALLFLIAIVAFFVMLKRTR